MAALVAFYVVVREHWEKWANQAQFEFGEPYVVCTEPKDANPEEIDWQEVEENLEIKEELKASGEWVEPWSCNMQVRIPIKQISGNPADEVECILKNAWRYQKDSQKLLTAEDVVPINLTWRHQSADKVRQRFLKGVTRECQIGHYGKHPDFYEENVDVFYLDTNERHGSLIYDEIPNIFESGLWKVELMLVGKNMEPIYKKIELEIRSGWRGEREGYERYLAVKSVE